MKLKQGVITEGVCPQLWWALGVADEIYRRHYKQLVVTSLRDGTHGEHSKHYLGQAADLRTRNLTHGEIDTLYAEIKSTLDPLGFDTVDERGKLHLHIEFDPKPGENWLTFVP